MSVKLEESELEKYLGVVAGSIPGIPEEDPIPAAPYDPASDDRIHWPKSKPLPTSYEKPKLIPCIKCLRIRLDNLGQAVMLTHTRDGIAYFRCKGCGENFKLAVTERDAKQSKSVKRLRR